jgi:hypothetical protein
MTKIAIYHAPNNARSGLIAQALMRGADRAGLAASSISSATYRQPDADIAIFYGLSDGLSRVFTDYRARGKTVLFVDLGYWMRRKRTRWDGYHKVCINSRHPTAYFQDKPRDRSRFASLDIPGPQPWRAKGRHIIVAGMSAKASAAEHMSPESWERAAVVKLRRLTSRPIIYRPKPNWLGARRIPGTMMDALTPLDQALRGCHAVVTHHSNVAVDALMAGVPCFTEGGAASVLSGRDLSQIETPPMPDGREQWARDLAFVQWNMNEMADGTMWRHFRDEGVIR